MTRSLRGLADFIRDELQDIDRAIERAAEGWQRSQLSSDDYYIDSVALNLAGFYTGLERIFESIAIDMDGVRHEGENWHQMLLQQMELDIHRCDQSSSR